MTYRDAFIHLRARLQEIQKIPAEGLTLAERNDEQALIIALEAMIEWSGSFHSSEMIRLKVPAHRLED